MNDDERDLMVMSDESELQEELRRLKAQLTVARQQHRNGEVYSLDEVEAMLRSKREERDKNNICRTE
ncbi:MAG: hypothetical protein FWG19_00685 [Methanomassiliicoccaceae archaeon]|nr:hypothetical protein [Methanomassiliicoccaceae archaeon]